MKKSLLCFVLASLIPVAHTATTPFEELPVLDAASLLGNEAVNRELYTIEPIVINDGRFNSYQIISPIQSSQVHTDSLMEERAHEIDSIVALRKIKESDAYQKGLEAAAEAPLTLTRKVIEDPVGTLEKLPQGLSNLLNDLGAAVNGIGRGSDAKKEDNAMMKDLLGFNTVKRRLAAEMQVDPYSSNEMLQKELNDVAWAMFAGGAPIDLAMMAAPAAVSVAARAIHRLNGGQLDWNIPPATIREAMDKQVMAMGLTPDESERLVYHKHCSLRHQSILVSAMLDLKDTAGRDAFLRQAMNAADEMACRNYQQLAELIWSYHQNVQPVTSISLQTDQVWLDDSQQQRVLVTIADYMAWTESNAGLFSSLPAGKAVSLWTSGRLSTRTTTELNQRKIAAHTLVSRQHPGYVRVVAVLLPERVAAEDAEQGNRTGKLVGGVADGVGNFVGDVFTGLGLQEKTADEPAGAAGDSKDSTTESATQ
jgi:hypothetical protein